MKYSIIFSVAAFTLASQAFGHHSDAALDVETVVMIEGTVTEFSLRNPHSYFVVETTTEAGEVAAWEVQLGSALSVSRRGWASETLPLGESVRVELSPARDGRPYGLFRSVEKNGLPIAYTRSAPPATVVATSSLEGVWIVDRESLGPDYPDGLAQLMSRDLRLTEKGSIAAASFNQDSAENPALSCVTKPTPGGLIYTDMYPMEIEFGDEQIIMIRIQYFDQERTIYMDGRQHPPVNERTHEGHSIGWWEEDVLVVDTANFADDRSPYQNGTPSGAQKHVVERYRLADDGTRLTLQFTLEDPEYLARTMMHSRDLLYSPHITMTPFNCDLESTRRYLPD